MANKRKQYNAEFKAKVALEAMRGQKTVPQLASQYQLHPPFLLGLAHRGGVLRSKKGGCFF
jgi:transposase-like protein